MLIWLDLFETFGFLGILAGGEMRHHRGVEGLVAGFSAHDFRA